MLDEEPDLDYLLVDDWLFAKPGTPRGGSPDGAKTPPLTARSNTQEVLTPKEVHLPENMWALNLIAAIGQAKTGNKLVSPYFTAVITMTMASLQIAVLFLDRKSVV